MRVCVVVASLLVAVLASSACSDSSTPPAVDLRRDSPVQQPDGPLADTVKPTADSAVPDHKLSKELGGAPDSTASVGSWKTASSPLMHTFWATWGSASDDVWAVGVAGKILHYTGGTWTEATSGHDKDLRGVWGKSKSDVWAAGSDGWILHYDGTAWSRTQVGSNTYFVSAATRRPARSGPSARRAPSATARAAPGPTSRSPPSRRC